MTVLVYVHKLQMDMHREGCTEMELHRVSTASQTAGLLGNDITFVVLSVY